jgi:hypothetical protein
VIFEKIRSATADGHCSSLALDKTSWTGSGRPPPLNWICDGPALIPDTPSARHRIGRQIGLAVGIDGDQPWAADITAAAARLQALPSG